MLDTELGNRENDNNEPDASGDSGPIEQERGQPASGVDGPEPSQASPSGSSHPEHGEPPSAADIGQGIPPVPAATFQPPQVIFQPPAVTPTVTDEGSDTTSDATHEPSGDGEGASGRRRRRRGGRGRGKSGDGTGAGDAADTNTGASDEAVQPSAESPSVVGAGARGEEARPDGSARSRRRSGRGGASAPSGSGKDGRDTGKDGGQDTGKDAGQDTGKDAGKNVGKGRAVADIAHDAGGEEASAAAAEDADGADTNGEETSAMRRRRRRRRRGGVSDAEPTGTDDPPNTVVHVREPRASGTDWAEEVQSVKGSTRLEAKKQRRREGRDSGRRRPPLLSESEFLARREAVHRVMLVRQRSERTQIAVLEDGVLVEHYVDRTTHQSMAGNIYLGKVQNVLPSMEAAFVDIGKGRNAVLYAGEINFDASGLEGQPKRIETVLKSGQSVLVQVTKDPVGHKGARLTNLVSLPGRYLVYVPGASMTGISRKLPAPERTRLKQILKKVTPEDAGVIVRTAAEGTGGEELARDVARLAAQWENIQRKAESASPPELLYSEPDLTIRVVRDIFNEDFSELVVAGDDGWDTVNEYVRYVAPHLAQRVRQWKDDADLFAKYRVDEQLAKALERKVWLPSGGSLVIDRTEAMAVIDVNTGKFTGQGGNLEETVTRNNLEAAEEIVRQLRLRDIGGIIVIDFIDMVLESNRELVMRRLLECLARDRTKHQVAEVTSLGLVQMTRKRVGSGLLEAFSQMCECCSGRGVLVSLDMLEPAPVKRSPSSRADGRTDAKGRGKTSVSADGSGRATEAEGQNESAADAVVADAPAVETRAEEKPPGRRRRRRTGTARGEGGHAEHASSGPAAGNGAPSEAPGATGSVSGEPARDSNAGT